MPGSTTEGPEPVRSSVAKYHGFSWLWLLLNKWSVVGKRVFNCKIRIHNKCCNEYEWMNPRYSTKKVGKQLNAIRIKLKLHALIFIVRWSLELKKLIWCYRRKRKLPLLSIVAGLLVVSFTKVYSGFNRVACGDKVSLQEVIPSTWLFLFTIHFVLFTISHTFSDLRWKLNCFSIRFIHN